jgi:Ca2+-transporting ATPase
MAELTLEKLLELMESKNPQDLQPLGGVDGIAKQLGSDIKGGLRQASEQELATRRQKYGENKVDRKPPPTLVELFIEAMQDTTIIILLFAAGRVLLHFVRSINFA